jgi:hypothetical protein
VPLGARLAAKHVLPSLTLAAAVTVLREMVSQRLTSTRGTAKRSASHTRLPNLGAGLWVGKMTKCKAAQIRAAANKSLRLT